MEDRQIITGYISNYIYESKDSMYKVCELTLDDNKTVVIVGSFPHLEDGLNYEFIGKLKEHPKYGVQFFVDSYQKSNSFSKEGLVLYLSSEKFYGIGPKLATKIVDTLGTNCIKTILDNKDSLKRVSGMNQQKIDTLYQTLKDNLISEQVFIRLFGFGLTAKMVERLYNTYNIEAANKIEENPYCLIHEVEGFGFKKCDMLALNLGIKKDSDIRISAAIEFTLNQVCYQQGFTFLTEEQLINSVIKLLDDSLLINKVNNNLNILVKDNRIVFDNGKYFDPYLYKCEENVAKNILRLKNGKCKEFKDNDIEEAIEYVENTISIIYTPLQREAIFKSIKNKLSIITGGPGTGKSTILKGILDVYSKLLDMPIGSDDFSYKVMLASPTGRASKRMSEATGFKASTIHKLLGYNFDGDFIHDENNQLPCSLLIVDETSMMDIMISSSLFQALRSDCRVILVGDSNQLPSVGPGNVLYDLIQSDIFSVTRLNQIMRQAKDSDIIKFSHMILSEELDYSIFSNKKEVFFYDSESKNCLDRIFQILDSFIKNGGDLQNGIQILAPMYAGVCGIDAINSAIQERYNKEESLLKRDTKVFKKNDKVLQLKNDTEKDIMNGDIGKILEIGKADDRDCLMIEFDGRVITYFASDLDNLTLAYCISIHKAQGSEFDNVIMPILPSFQIMLKKKIIYTGITRAKKKLILLGKINSISQAIHQEDYLRQTYLSKRLHPNTDLRINDKDIPFDTLGEYDMEGISPYSFL